MRSRFTIQDLFMFLVALIWALNFSVIKVALLEIPPILFTTIRFVVSTILLIPLVARLEGGLGIVGGYHLRLFLLGVVGITAYQLVFIIGVHNTNASNASLILATSPIFTAIIAQAAKFDRLGPVAWAGVLASFGGIYLVVTGGSGSPIGSETLLGDLLILFGASLWALSTVMAVPVLQVISPLKVTVYSMVWGTLLLLPFAAQSARGFDLSTMSVTGWLATAYSTIFAILLSYVLWYKVVKDIGPTRTQIYTILVPVLAIIFAFFVLNERLNVLQWLGVAICLYGVRITRVNKWL
ncbi:DMT family transporter [candidate division KSB1 bacterium]